MDDKLLFTIIAVTISAINFVYYMYTVYFGKTKPHLYTWLIWGIVTAIAAAAQFVEGAGVGAWLTTMVAGFCFARAFVAIHRGVQGFTKSDKICLMFCLIAIVLWQITDNPLMAVIIVTIIDMAGFYPTMRNGWKNPYDENNISFTVFGMTYLLGIFALENYNLTTVLYPAAICISSWLFVFYILWRRAVIGKGNLGEKL